MNSSDIEYVKYFIEAIIILVAGKDLILKKSKVWWKRISLAGWILVVFALLGFATSVTETFVGKIEKKKESHTVDSIRNADKEELKNSVDAALRKYNLKLNHTTKAVTVINSSEKIPDPVIDVVIDSTKIVGSLDKPLLQIQTRCINNSVAYHIKSEMISFSYSKGKFGLIGAKPIKTETDLNAYGNNLVYYKAMLYPVPRNAKITDTTFYFFKQYYENKNINGKEQPPLRKVFFVAIEDYPNSVSEIKVKQLDNQDMFREIKTALIKNSRW